MTIINEPLNDPRLVRHLMAFISVNDAASETGFGRTKLYEAMADKSLPYVKGGGDRRILRLDLYRWLSAEIEGSSALLDIFSSLATDCTELRTAEELAQSPYGLALPKPCGSPRGIRRTGEGH